MPGKKTRLTLKDLNKALPDEVGQKYEVVGLEKRTTTAAIYPKFGKINFKTISLAKAEYLVKNKFPYLKKKSSKTSAE